MSPERNLRVLAIVEVEWGLGVVLSDIVVNPDRNVGVPAPCPKQFENAPLVAVKLGSAMIEDEFDG